MSTTGKLEVVSPTNPTFLEIVKLDQNFEPAWSETEWRSLDPKHHCFFVWNVDDMVQGFALFVTLPQEPTAHLLKIYLYKDLRGSSHGTQFWNSICEILKQKSFKEVYLEVKAQNAQALKFYQKLGFKTLRRTSRYYSDGSDGVMMNLTI